MKDIVLRSVGIHDGKFHADEVTACAFLIMCGCIDRDKIVRTRSYSELSRCEYRCDVGGEYDPASKNFDHHQASYRGAMSSAGMILLYLKDEGLLTPEEYDLFNDAFVRGVDAHDNGIITQEDGTMTLSHVVSGYNTIDGGASSEPKDAKFYEALDFVYGVIERLREGYEYAKSCHSVVAEQMALSERFLIFDAAVPWQEPFFELGGKEHPALFVVMPCDGKWKLRGIPPSYNDMEVRVPFPESWAGLLGDELREVSGIPGAVFCHKGKFIAIFKTKEAALAALDYVLNKECL
ncbi:MAG: MYG1 family protein [Waddliaceae bacterium]|nr:MYG1 family protein [Waddliaceae bacterium]